MPQVYNVVLKRRSIRRFKQRAIPTELLKKLLNAARLAPSTANIQPCEFILVDLFLSIYSCDEFIVWTNS